MNEFSSTLEVVDQLERCLIDLEKTSEGSMERYKLMGYRLCLQEVREKVFQLYRVRQLHQLSVLCGMSALPGIFARIAGKKS